jgi:ribosomal protein L37AE/L43A
VSHDASPEEVTAFLQHVGARRPHLLTRRRKLKAEATTRGVCPFCEQNTLSIRIRPWRDSLYYCFECHAGDFVGDYVREHSLEHDADLCDDGKEHEWGLRVTYVDRAVDAEYVCEECLRCNTFSLARPDGTPVDPGLLAALLDMKGVDTS